MPFFRKGYKNKPLPIWFQNWISKQKLIRYKDLLVPYVQFNVIRKGDSGEIFIAFSINGKDVYGNILTFPYSWTQRLTIDDLLIGFEQKLSRHLNMISKGSSRGTPQQVKTIIDSTFQVNCLISPKHKPQRTRHIILRTNTKGQVMNISGQMVGISGTALIKQLAIANQQKLKNKKKQSFNPSKR